MLRPLVTATIVALALLAAAAVWRLSHLLARGWPLLMAFPPKSASGYRLVSDASGPNIRPGATSPLQYYVGGDPTHGFITYGAYDDLISLDGAGRAVVAVGAPTGGPRRAIRLVSKDLYSSGLFVIDAAHIPEGLGAWPAFWLAAREPAGAAWACHGEIDVIEGVNSVDAASSRNQSTLHTSDRPDPAGGPPLACRQAGVPGISSGGNCSAGGDASCGCDRNSVCPYSGCGVVLASTASFGKGFNDAGGGVYACELTPGGAVTVWFFPRSGQVPPDLAAGAPDPSSWPAANRTAFKPCPGQFAYLQLILNTTLCGDWAGAVYPGGAGKCVADMKTADLSRAYWAIASIRVYALPGVGAVIPGGNL